MKKVTHVVPTFLLGAGALLASSVAPVCADTAVDKLGRGVAGMVGGVLEVPGNMVEEHDRRGPSGLPLGFAKGLGMLMVREVVGVYEFVTAPLPSYQPVLQPEYPWDYFAESRQAKVGRRSVARLSGRAAAFLLASHRRT